MDSLTQKLLEENERRIADVFLEQQQEQQEPQEQEPQEQDKPQQILSQDEQQPKEEISTLDDLSNLVRSIREKTEADVVEAVDADTINYNPPPPPPPLSSIVESEQSATINYVNNDPELAESIIPLDPEVASMLDKINEQDLEELEEIRDFQLGKQQEQLTNPQSGEQPIRVPMSANEQSKTTTSASSMVKKLKNIRYNITAAADTSGDVSKRLRQKLRNYNRDRVKKAKNNLRRQIIEPIRPLTKEESSISEREIQETMKEVREDIEQFTFKNICDVVDRNVYRRELERKTTTNC